MARTPKPVDEQKLRNLALIGLTNEKIATALSISHDTLVRRYRKELAEARGDGEMRILAKIFQKCMDGNMTALQLAAINRLGWSTRPEVAISVVQNAVTTPLPTPAQMRERLIAARKFLEEHDYGSPPEPFDTNRR